MKTNKRMMINTFKLRLKNKINAKDVGGDGEPTQIEAAQTSNHSLTR